MGTTTTTKERDAWEKKLAGIEKRRAARRRYLEAQPLCPVCGGRTVAGQCVGDGVIRCGLFTGRA